jgi:hypothetical protein
MNTQGVLWDGRNTRWLESRRHWGDREIRLLTSVGVTPPSMNLNFKAPLPWSLPVAE